MSERHIVRDKSAADSMEMMLVFAVGTILAIRGFLALTGYPQLGGGTWHVAHMLWGGVGMFLSIGLLLSFWSSAMRQLAAAVGGVGFGFFIDELGKFVTADNDYFFQPTIAMLYIVFIALFLSVRAIGSRPLTDREISANQEIVAVLSGGANISRMARAYSHIDEYLQLRYRRLVSTRWFAPALIAAFVVMAVVEIGTVIALVTGRSGTGGDRQIPWLEQAATATSAAFVVLGALRLRRSRLSAYRWFQRATLLAILVTQVFMFYYSELAAVGGLLGKLLIYFALRILIAREKEELRETGKEDGRAHKRDAPT